MHAWQQCMTIGILLLIAGCSGGTGNTQNTPTTSATSRVNALPTFSFSQPTEPPQFATVAATLTTNTNSTAEALTLDSEAVERGKGRYEALDCASCHGQSGEGTDQGASLLEYDVSAADFVTFMRSGGSLGTAHQYASNRLSESGAANLYQYLLSFQGQ